MRGGGELRLWEGGDKLRFGGEGESFGFKEEAESFGCVGGGASIVTPLPLWAH